MLLAITYKADKAQEALVALSKMNEPKILNMKKANTGNKNFIMMIHASKEDVENLQYEVWGMDRVYQLLI